MPPSVALALWFVVIVFLFVRDNKNHPDLSPALWIPLVWLFLIGSKSLSSWLSLGEMQFNSIEAYAEGNPLDRYSLLLLFVLATVIVLKRNLQWSALFRENRLFFYFIFYCLISTAWSEFPFISLRKFIRFSGIVPMTLLILSERSPIEAIMAILRRCSYLLVSLSVLFIRYFPHFGRYYNPFTYETAYCGVGGNKNELGIICLVAFMIFFWDLAQMKGNIRDFARSVETWTTLLLLLMSGYLLSIAHSATSLFCVLIGSLIIFGTSRPILNKNLRIVAYRVVSISVLLAFAQIFFNISNLIIATLGRDPTLTNRTFIWEFLLGMGTNPIVGVGYESFWTTNRILYAASSGYAVLQSHNGYIETYLNLGFIGVMFFMAFLVKCFRIVVRDLPAEFTLNQFRLAFLIVFGLYNYTEAAFPSPGLLGPIFFLFIIVVPRTSSQQVLDIDFDNASPAGS